MSQPTTEHRGVGYIIRGQGQNRWQWSIHPTGGAASRAASGVTMGAREAAEKAARAAIERHLAKRAKAAPQVT